MDAITEMVNTVLSTLGVPTATTTPSKGNCAPELHYKYVHDGFTLNENDCAGLAVLSFLMAIMGVFGYVAMSGAALPPARRKTVVSAGGALLAVWFAVIVYRPILLLYAPSAIMTMFIRTPVFLDRTTYFPKSALFEDPATYRSIRQEVDAMLKRTNGGNKLTLTQDTYSGENTYIGSDVRKIGGTERAWRLKTVKAGYTYATDAREHFPTLVKVLENVPEVKSCVVSVLEPGIRIPIHVGYYKGILRYMLPTHIPRDKHNVYMCANGEKYAWTEGVGVLWDDTYVHKVFNYSDEVRVLIYMDVVRPLSPDADTWKDAINRFILQLATGSSVVQNEVRRTERQVPVVSSM